MRVSAAEILEGVERRLNHALGSHADDWRWWENNVKQTYERGVSQSCGDEDREGGVLGYDRGSQR